MFNNNRFKHRADNDIYNLHGSMKWWLRGAWHGFNNRFKNRADNDIYNVMDPQGLDAVDEVMVTRSKARLFSSWSLRPLIKTLWLMASRWREGCLAQNVLDRCYQIHSLHFWIGVSSDCSSIYTKGCPATFFSFLPIFPTIYQKCLTRPPRTPANFLLPLWSP